MSGFWELVAAVVLGLAINESSKLSPWLAQKLVRWAARVRYPTRAEELSALIAERPGKLFKLVTASGFACAALTYRITQRKTAPVHSATSRFWIGCVSVLAAGILLTGEILLASVITNAISNDPSVIPSLLDLIILGAIAAFVTATELLVSTYFPVRWATTVTGFTLALIVVVLYPHSSTDDLLLLGGMAAAASVSESCAIRLGNRLRFPAIAALSTILGACLLTLGLIWVTSTNTPLYIDRLAWMLDLGFAVGFSVGFGVLLWHVFCGRRPPQSSSEKVSPTAT